MIHAQFPVGNAPGPTDGVKGEFIAIDRVQPARGDEFRPVMGAAWQSAPDHFGADDQSGGG